MTESGEDVLHREQVCMAFTPEIRISISGVKSTRVSKFYTNLSIVSLTTLPTWYCIRLSKFAICNKSVLDVTGLIK